MNFKILAAGLLLSLAAKPALAEPCDAMIRDLVAHASKPNSGSTSYGVRFNLMTMKKPARWIGVIVDGYLDASGTGLKHGQSAQHFSDRYEGSQRFARAKYDSTTVELSATGQMKYVLNSWGNATTTYNTTCSNGFMYATSGEHFHVLSFNKVSEYIID